MAPLRERVWSQSGATTGTDPVLLDIDASLVEIHSENKEQTAATFKGGFGSHPLLCFADATGETLAGVLRPGNAGSNTVADHVAVLDQAIGQLPCRDRPRAPLRRRGGDDRTRRRGASRLGRLTEGFLSACRARNVGFYVTARSNAQVTEAIFDAEGVTQVWLPALDRHGEPRTDGAAVAELTCLIEDSKLPSGTRLIVRREPLHPGAQRSLFPSFEFRY